MILDSNVKTKELRLEIYADEIGKIRCFQTNEVWMYLGAIFIPEYTKTLLLDNLNDFRCLDETCNKWHIVQKDCPVSCKYHEMNNTEIHYYELDRSKARFKIAKKWLSFALKNGLDHNLLYFNILGLNLSNMNMEMFGDSETDANIYNRFFRTVLKSGLKYFFQKKSKITLSTVYHDNGGQVSHPYFPWQPLRQLRLELPNLRILNPMIQFLDSDHRKSKKPESQFIQLIDLILGSMLINFHAQSEKKEKKDIGLLFQPHLKKIMDRKVVKTRMIGEYYKEYNPYYRKCNVSFFPKNKLERENALIQLDLFGDSVESEKVNNFYYNREIFLKDSRQATLF